MDVIFAHRERTCGKLLGPIGEERTMRAECVFVDPIADLAALRSPDCDAFDEEAEAYDALVERTIPPPIGELPLTGSAIALPTGTILGPPGSVAVEHPPR